MKRTLRIFLLAFTMVMAGSLPNSLSAQYDYNNIYDYGRNGEVTYQTFYDELSPYGRWIEYPGYGYVWVPEAENDFRPYSSNGHWVYTDNYEWLWVSDYDWGWAPFHYGRWEEDPYYGWFWVPGYEWSPAWVAWRDGGDYYGWAPLRPGININYNYNMGSYNPPYSYWSFVPRRYVSSPRVYDYYIDRRSNITIINYTTIINANWGGYDRYGFRSGPSRYDAERYCGRINPVRFRDSYSPGRTFYRNNEVSIYRPRVRAEQNRVETPRQFERYDRSNGFRNRAANNEVRPYSDGGFRRTDENRTGNDVRRPDDRRMGDGSFRRTETPVRTEDNNNYRRPQDDQFRRPDNTPAPRNDNPGSFRRDNNSVVRPETTPAPRTDDNNFRRPERRIDNGGGQQTDRRVIQPEQRNYKPEASREPGTEQKRFERRTPDENQERSTIRVNNGDEQSNFRSRF